MKNLLAMLVFAMLLAGCQKAEIDPAFDEVAGAALLAKYEAARADQDFEIAEAHGNELRQRHGETQAAATMRKTLEVVRTEAEAMREARRLKALWEYQSIPAAGGIQHTAAIQSYVESDPDAEEGELIATPDAKLILRRHPEWGDSAYLVLAQRALQCPPPCVLQIRFDDGQAQRFTGDPADTGTGPALFIEERDRFLEAMRGARRVRIELPAAGHLAPAFEFEVGGFRAPAELVE